MATRRNKTNAMGDICQTLHLARATLYHYLKVKSTTDGLLRSPRWSMGGMYPIREGSGQADQGKLCRFAVCCPLHASFIQARSCVLPCARPSSAEGGAVHSWTQTNVCCGQSSKSVNPAHFCENGATGSPGTPQVAVRHSCFSSFQDNR
jgi:hypothetical protein